MSANKMSFEISEWKEAGRYLDGNLQVIHSGMFWNSRLLLANYKYYVYHILFRKRNRHLHRFWCLKLQYIFGVPSCCKNLLKIPSTLLLSCCVLLDSQDEEPVHLYYCLHLYYHTPHIWDHLYLTSTILLLSCQMSLKTPDLVSPPAVFGPNDSRSHL